MGQRCSQRRGHRNDSWVANSLTRRYPRSRIEVPDSTHEWGVLMVWACLVLWTLSAVVFVAERHPRWRSSEFVRLPTMILLMMAAAASMAMAYSPSDLTAAVGTVAGVCGLLLTVVLMRPWLQEMIAAESEQSESRGNDWPRHGA